MYHFWKAHCPMTMRDLPGPEMTATCEGGVTMQLPALTDTCVIREGPSIDADKHVEQQCLNNLDDTTTTYDTVSV